MFKLSAVVEQLNDLDMRNIGVWPRWFYWVTLLLLGVVTVAGGVYFLISPQIENINRLTLKEHQLKSEFLIKSKQADSLSIYQNKRIVTEQNVQNLLRYLSAEDEIADLLNDIAELSGGSGLNLNIIKLGDAIGKDFYTLIPISITVSGEFNQLVMFLSALSTLSKIVLVEDLQIGKDAQLSRLIMDVQIYAYQLRENIEIQS